MPSVKKVRPVPLYLAYKERAGCSPHTITRIRGSLKFYADFLGVPLVDLHKHMTAENFLDYLEGPHAKKLAPNSRRSTISAISTYMRINGIEFDELEMAVVKVRVPYERNDKPPSFELFQRMMDVADTRMKAIITFLISTGCRRGETSKILLSDVDGSVVTIRNGIAKGHRGGKVFLNAEAREYLDLWLLERDRWIKRADQLAKQLNLKRPALDLRLFASSDNEIGQRFSDIYKAVDGETVTTQRGERNLVTCHSCRAYFRTNAVKTMGIDLVEGIMRHTGYLNAAYVRMPEEERERLYHEGEDALYITRRDRRMSETALELEKQKRESLEREFVLTKKMMAKEIAEIRKSLGEGGQD